MNNPPTLMIVVPCYNEQAALPITAEKLFSLINDLLLRELLNAESAV